MQQTEFVTIKDLMTRFPRAGKVEWIGLRPARKAALSSVNSVTILSQGLEGDHRNKPGKRAVTLIQAEHLPVIAALSGHETVDPATLRRNIVVSGIPLIALKGVTFKIGTAVLRGTDACVPCSRMEENLGPGGYNAMRDHGGITAEVIEEGVVALGDAVAAAS